MRAFVMKISKKVLAKIRNLKTETYMLYLAYKDPRVKWYVKAFLLLILAYALSPVDIIPDFIPVLGYLDDVLILPVGIYFAVKMIPTEIRDECRLKAQSEIKDLKIRWAGLAIVIMVWLVLLGFIIYALIRL